MTTANATCYFPDGIVNNSSESCNPSADVSHCCGPTFVCLSNRLCLDPAGNHIIRGTCTDVTWTDERCPPYCKDDTTDVYGEMRQCNGQDALWVCGLDVSDCTLENSFQLPIGYIDDNRSTSLPAIIALPTVYTQASAGTGSTATKTVTVTRTATAQPSPTAKSLDAVKVGLGAGLGLGLPLLTALCVSLLLLYRAQKKLNASEYGQNAGPPQQFAAPAGHHTPAHTPKGLPKQEADTQNVHEVAGSTF